MLSFGGTKNGGLGAEAVVVLRPDLGRDLLYRRKQAMQLASKMRYVAAQFVALLSDDLWRRNAAHANAMAARLAAAVGGRTRGEDHPAGRGQRGLRGPRRPAVTEPLQAAYPFYVWDEGTGEVRWMTSFATTEPTSTTSSPPWPGWSVRVAPCPGWSSTSR